MGRLHRLSRHMRDPSGINHLQGGGASLAGTWMNEDFTDTAKWTGADASAIHGFAVAGTELTTSPTYHDATNISPSYANIRFTSVGAGGAITGIYGNGSSFNEMGWFDLDQDPLAVDHQVWWTNIRSAPQPRYSGVRYGSGNLMADASLVVGNYNPLNGCQAGAWFEGTSESEADKNWIGSAWSGSTWLDNTNWTTSVVYVASTTTFTVTTKQGLGSSTDTIALTAAQVTAMGNAADGNLWGPSWNRGATNTHMVLDMTGGPDVTAP